MLLLLTLVIPMGCGADPDKTGENGIGAAGVPPQKVMTEEEARQFQLQQEAELTKASNSKK
jgi:hypothetical protein